MITMHHEDGLAVLEATEKIRQEDYQRIVPQLEKALEEKGKLRCLVHLHDIDGIELRALVEELKFDIAHRKHFERCAVVGDRPWEKAATKLGRIWFTGDVRYFDNLDEARRWVRGA